MKEHIRARHTSLSHTLCVVLCMVESYDKTVSYYHSRNGEVWNTHCLAIRRGIAVLVVVFGSEVGQDVIDEVRGHSHMSLPVQANVVRSIEWIILCTIKKIF